MTGKFALPTHVEMIDVVALATTWRRKRYFRDGYTFVLELVQVIPADLSTRSTQGKPISIPVHLNDTAGLCLNDLPGERQGSLSDIQLWITEPYHKTEKMFKSMVMKRTKFDSKQIADGFTALTWSISHSAIQANKGRFFFHRLLVARQSYNPDFRSTAQQFVPWTDSIATGSGLSVGRFIPLIL